MVFVMSLIVDALAPTFGGTKSPIQALKLVAYACTSVFVGGIFSIIPSLGILGVADRAVLDLPGLHRRIAVLMRCPPEKAGGYTAVVIVCGIVARASSSARVLRGDRAVAHGHAGMPGAGRRQHDIKTPDGAAVTIDGDSMAAMAQRMEAAGERAKAAQNSGDPPPRARPSAT